MYRLSGKGLFAIIALSIIISAAGIAPDDNKVPAVIYLEPSSKGVDVHFTQDSSAVSFGIYKKEFETPEARKKEMEKFERKSTDIVPPIKTATNFSYNFSSIAPPVKLNKISGDYVTVEQFRNKPVTASEYYLIYKAAENKYLKYKIHPTPVK